MLILKLSLNQFMVANHPIKNHLLKHIKNILIVVMDTKLFAVITANIPNQYNIIEEKKLFTNLWNPC